jgi:D-3-phosphoglycerate dehydrogenase
MIASITGVLGGFGVNIKTLHNDSRSQISYNLVDIEVNIDSALADEIRQIPDVLRVRLLRL